MTTDEFNKCIDTFSDGLYRFMLHHTNNNSDEASDYVQDSFLKLWEKRNEVAFEKAKSYLFTTANHLLIDTIRKNKVEAKYINEKTFSTAHYSLDPEYNNLQDILDKILNKMPADQKTVVMLRDYEGYTYEEIAAMTNLSLAQVKVYIYRARTYLKQHLAQWHD